MADSPFEKPKWSLKKKLLVCVALPLAVLLGALLILDAMAGGRLKTAMREARDIGGPVTFDELVAARKVWPEGKNGADVILKLQDRLAKLSKDDKRLEPLPGFEERMDSSLGHRLAPERDKAAAEVLAHLEPELAEIDRLLQYSGGRFPLTIAANPIDTVLPHLKLVRTSAKLKAAQAQYRAMHGDTTHAVDDCRIILLHAQLMADEPMFTSGMLRMACESLAADTAQRICALTALTPEQLTQLQSCFIAAQCQDRLAWGIRGERASFLVVAAWVRQQGLPKEPTDDSDRTGESSIRLGLFPGVRGLFVRDEAAGLRLQNRIVAAAGDRRKAMRTTKEIASEAEKLPAYALVTRIMTPSFERAFILDGNLEAQIRSATAGLAAERYRLDYGRFPEKLEDLVPQYLSQVPLDPFNDEPLRLRNYDGALLIYSVGADLTDNGGSMEGWSEKRPYSDWGFVLLPPERRGLPATQPATEPAADLPVESAEEKAERLRRFREGEPRAASPATQ